MAQKLILYRHAKSDWETDFKNDHERPLAPRGIEAAKTMGTLLASSGQVPDLVICSTAARALQTLELSVKAGKWVCDIQMHDSLYSGDLETFRNIVLNCPDNTDRIMLVGHEPNWSEFAAKLIGGGNIKFPTAAMCRIDFKISKWTELQFGQGQLRWMLQPSFFTNSSTAPLSLP